MAAGGPEPREEGGPAGGRAGGGAGAGVPEALVRSVGARAGALAGLPGAGWLRGRLGTPEGTEEVCARLAESVEGPGFLAALEQEGGGAAGDSAAATEATAAAAVGEEGFWAGGPESPAGGAGNSPGIGGGEGGEGLQEWQLVDQQDVLDAVAAFIAAYLLQQPEARGMAPDKLQAALALTFNELRKGRLESMWAWGKTLYRYSAVTYGAYGLYTNPWVARASLQALWACAKVICSAGAGLVIL